MPVHNECFKLRHDDAPIDGEFTCASCEQLEGPENPRKRQRSVSRGRQPNKAKKEHEESTIMQFLAAFKDDLSTKFNVLQTTVNNQFMEFRNELSEVKQSHSDIVESISFVSQKYDEMVPRVEKAVADSISAKETVGSIQTQVDKSTERLDKLEASVNKQAQASLQNNLVITGLAKSNNPVDTFWKLVNATKAKVTPDDVANVELLRKYESKNNDASGSKNGLFVADTILVRFNSNAAKGELIKAKKSMGAAFSDQVQPLSASDSRTKRPRTIFFRDHLTDYSMALFELAKRKQEELKYQFVWTRNGQILMKQKESAAVHRINSAADLAKLPAIES